MLPSHLPGEHEAALGHLMSASSRITRRPAPFVPSGLLAGLERALELAATHEGAEAVACVGPRIARMWLTSDGIAWIQCQERVGASLADRLAPPGTPARQLFRSVLREMLGGRDFVGLLDRAGLSSAEARVSFAHHLSDQLRWLVAGAGTVSFEARPARTPIHMPFAFSVAELLEGTAGGAPAVTLRTGERVAPSRVRAPRETIDMLAPRREPPPRIDGVQAERCLGALASTEGFVAGAVVRITDEAILAIIAEGRFPMKELALEAAATVRAQLRILRSGTTGEALEDIVTTTVSHVHIVRPATRARGVVVVVVVDRDAASLAMARHAVAAAEPLLTPP